MLRIKYYYDILCPYSWLGFQILAQKTSTLREIGDCSIDYIPHMWPKVYKTVASHITSDISKAQYNYVQKDLRDICEYYDLPVGKFEKMYTLKNRSNTCIWFLNLVKDEHPGLHKTFMEKFWERIFLEDKTVNGTNDILDVCNQLNLPFTVSQRLCMRTESRPNVQRIVKNREYLEEIKAIGSPWIEVKVNNMDLSFYDVMRLELIEEIFKDPALVLNNDRFARISAF